MSRFKKMKFRVHSPTHSEQIQKKLFELGYCWADGTTEIKHTGAWFLYTGAMPGAITFSNSATDFTNQLSYQETTLEELSGAPKEEVTKSKQIGGEHYTLKAIQPWDIIKAWDLDFYRGNVLKYILRAPYKNGVEDIEKAIHYLEHIRDNYKEIFKDGL